MNQEYNYKVCTLCITYNQASIITDAMNGFVKQKTSFPVITIINDDASTDGEPEIIRQYLSDNFLKPYYEEETDNYSLICAQHQTNENCCFVVFLLKYNHFSIQKDSSIYWSNWLNNTKYLAVCEGDDYWIHPQKIQMQYDFLESHQDYSMCCHNAIVWDTARERVQNFNSFTEGELSSSTVIKQWCAPTASLFYRSELAAYPDWLVKIYSGDMALILRCLNAGKIYYFDKLMSVYRKNSCATSLSSNMAKRGTFVLEQQILLLNSFDEGTNYKFHKDIKKVVKEKTQIIRYANSNLIQKLFEPYLYKLIVRRIKRMITA